MTSPASGGAGLRLGWALVHPGDYPRSVALSRTGPQAVVLVLGTVLTLAVAGSIEGFVTGSSLPTTVRVGIGVLVELTFLTWVVLCGRAGRRRHGGQPPEITAAMVPGSYRLGRGWWPAQDATSVRGGPSL